MLGIGGTIFVNGEDYTIVKTLGRGAYGCAYLARNRSGEECVVKCFTNSDDRKEEEDAYKLVKEANVSALVPTLLFVNYYWLVTTLAPGKTLYQTFGSLKAGPHTLGKDKVSTIYKVAIALLKAVATLNAAGLVHRDIKPDNVMVDIHGEEVVVTLIDLGLLVKSSTGDSRNYTHFFRSPAASFRKAVGKDDCFAAIWTIILAIMPTYISQDYTSRMEQNQPILFFSKMSLSETEAMISEIEMRTEPTEEDDFDACWNSFQADFFKDNARRRASTEWENTQLYLLQHMEECPAKKGLAELFRMAFLPNEARDVVAAIEKDVKPTPRSYRDALLGR